MTFHKPIEGFFHFQEDVSHRLKMGRLQYGDRSFSYEPSKLVKEIREELLDICGWSFILCRRLDKLSEKFESLSKLENELLKIRGERAAK